MNRKQDNPGQVRLLQRKRIEVWNVLQKSVTESSERRCHMERMAETYQNGTHGGLCRKASTNGSGNTGVTSRLQQCLGTGLFYYNNVRRQL